MKPDNQNSTATRPGKRLRTRMLLVETASSLVREKGYSNFSMEEVAARAGVTRGSIYGNFRDRNELLVAVALLRMPRVTPAPVQGASLQEMMHAYGKVVARAARDNRENTIHWAAYMQHALSDPDLRRRVDVQTREVRKQLVREWSEAIPVDALPMPVETFVKVIGALTSSLIMSHSMSPDDYDESVIVAAFAALAGERKMPRKVAKSRR